MSKSYKRLKDLLVDIPYTLLQGSLDVMVHDIKDNSTEVTEGDLFLAVVGTLTDSHRFIPSAISQGASVIVIERDMDLAEIDSNTTVIQVSSSRQALSYLSIRYFDEPATKLCTIGITGTCGKTSTSYILRSILTEQGYTVGIIGTIGALIGDMVHPTHNTTPNPYEIQKLFYAMVEAGCTHCIMEVSSQGLKMDRVLGILFDYGIFTNLSLDHIGENEHADYEEYRYCKSLLFKQCKVGMINVDSTDHPYITKNHTCKLLTYSIHTPSDLQATNITYVNSPDFFGMEFTTSGLLENTFPLAIPGEFSVYNALSALMLAYALEIPCQVIQQAFGKVYVEGRMEVVSSNHTYQVIIDYAHNYAEMDSLMDTISHYNPNRLICIFGGGGNRSKDRRYDMGEIAGKYADLTILTQDNPRFESLDSINADIITGLNRNQGEYIIIQDRKEAISYAIQHAQVGDIILLIGKGHEKYQEIEGVFYDWDEKEAVRSAEEELGITD